ncbi:LL-diaminopimelate aminotransferase [Planctomycetes bacterium Pan216]|uniref:Aminotransferase n=1 Tax=Kolteria novifilia TaxID=2527975 RepID=A0A518B043_9BACT|nr:LL-diaminopimelate aminotransferase [Planctomycetes bacterium Pan216]
MSDTYLQKLFAERIGGENYGKNTAIYKFEKIKRAKQAARAAMPDVELIDMGVGEPDEPAHEQVVEILRKEAGDPGNRGYTDNGIPEFKEAAARYMQNLFGVAIDPATEVNHAIGSKSALTLLPACFINPGDITVMTTPGYPVFGTHAKYYGGEVVNLPLTAENNFLPQLETLTPEQCKRAKVVVLNYPNNPTGASATPAFFEKAVAFAKKHELILIHDAAYAGLVFEGKPLSILSTPGAKDVALELHSLSKAYNMTGWRIGFVCGNELLVRAFSDVKDNSDSGQFAAIQKAGAYCLDHPEITASIAEKYSRRMDLLVPVLREHGFDAKKPAGSFFLYVGAPKAATSKDGHRIEFASAEEVSQFLITALLLSTVPWDDAGAFVRWSVTFAAATPEDEKRIVAEIDKRLGKLTLEF